MRVQSPVPKGVSGTGKITMMRRAPAMHPDESARRERPQSSVVTLEAGFQKMSEWMPSTTSWVALPHFALQWVHSFPVHNTIGPPFPQAGVYHCRASRLPHPQAPAKHRYRTARRAQLAPRAEKAKIPQSPRAPIQAFSHRAPGTEVLHASQHSLTRPAFPCYLIPAAPRRWLPPWEERRPRGIPTTTLRPPATP